MRSLKVLLVACLFMMPVSAFAAIGIGVELGGGSGTHEENYFFYEGDVDTSHANISFVYDSNPYAQHSNFAYRLNIGLESRELEGEYGVTMDTGALVFDNTFAFTLTKNDKATFWLGPQVRVGFIGGETDQKELGEALEASGFMFGLGVAIGTNIKTSDNVGIGLSAGLRSIGIAGTEEWGGWEDDFEIGLGELFVNACVLFN